MSIPVDYTSALLKSLSQDRLNNLIAQADARRILQEVKESPENYPAFDPLLTEKVTHIAYALLSCGCSLIEGADDSADEAENLGILERAGKLLSDAYRYNDSEADEKNYNLLIAGMALYAAKQYSRAFIVLKDINLDFSVGQLIIQFVKKDFNSLLKSTSKVFFEDFCELSNIQVLDEWVISHEIARIFMIITDYVQTGNKDDFTIIDDINLLRARTKALLNRIPNRAARKKLIASGIPLTVSMAILDDIDKFKSLALSFILSTDAEDQIEQTNNIVREIEIWSNANAANLMEFVPNQTILDNFRHCWISGMPLSEITNSEPNAAKISKDYYGYTLPWIIHAISQMFDSESEQIFIQAYSSIAMFVELGLPNVTSSNIYLAGVRSRGAALELSNFDVFQNKSISEVKQILSSFQLQDCEISETTKAWIKLLSDSANSQKPKEVSFPAFTWKRNGLPDKLYLRETNGDCFLISEDGYFYEKVESTSELPFLKIANILGLYFERDDDIWNLRSNNPKITVR